MAIDETLAARVRHQLRARDGLVEKKMFGGLAFLLHGSMCVGVHGPDLIVRCEKAATATLLRRTGARPFDLSGKPSVVGWLLVAPTATRTARGLAAWVAIGLRVVTAA